MDDLRLGAICRALQRRLGWRQSDLAERVGVHQTTTSRIERGQLAGVTVAELRRIFGTIGARFEPTVLWRGGELDRLMDERHAAIVEAAAGVFAGDGWRTILEVTFSHYADRGSIDLFCGHDATQTVAVDEMKASINSVEETHRRHDVKVRFASQLAMERFGWRPKAVGRLLIVPEDRTIRRVVASHSPLFDATYPARSRQVKDWIRTPSGPIAGLWFLSPNRHGHASQGAPGPHRVERARAAGDAPSDMRGTHA